MWGNLGLRNPFRITMKILHIQGNRHAHIPEHSIAPYTWTDLTPLHPLRCVETVTDDSSLGTYPAQMTPPSGLTLPGVWNAITCHSMAQEKEQPKRASPRFLRHSPAVNSSRHNSGLYILDIFKNNQKTREKQIDPESLKDFFLIPSTLLHRNFFTGVKHNHLSPQL